MFPKTVVIPLERGWHDIYDDNLRHLANGKALWGHKASLRDIQIGDVGYFAGGEFEFLFSITDSRDPKAIPNEFKPISFDRTQDVETNTTFMKPGEFYTSSKVLVEEVPEEGDGPRQYILNCSEKESAILICFDTATKTRLKREALARWRNFMKKNIQIWYEHVHKGWHAFGSMELFILVTGTVKTLRWASAAFQGAGKHKLNVWPEWGVQADVSCSPPLQGRAQSGPGPRNWSNKQIKDIDPEFAQLLPPPQPFDPYTHDQCLFVHYLTLSTKWPILTLKAASAPRRFGPPGDEDDDSPLATSRETLNGQKTYLNGTYARATDVSNSHAFCHSDSCLNRDHLSVPAGCSCIRCSSGMSVVPECSECSCGGCNALGIPTAIVPVSVC